VLRYQGGAPWNIQLKSGRVLLSYHSAALSRDGGRTWRIVGNIVPADKSAPRGGIEVGVADVIFRSDNKVLVAFSWTMPPLGATTDSHLCGGDRRGVVLPARISPILSPGSPAVVSGRAETVRSRRRARCIHIENPLTSLAPRPPLNEPAQMRRSSRGRLGASFDLELKAGCDRVMTRSLRIDIRNPHTFPAGDPWLSSRMGMCGCKHRRFCLDCARMISVRTIAFPFRACNATLNGNRGSTRFSRPEPDRVRRNPLG
jgi:hypothetical protein